MDRSEIIKLALFTTGKRECEISKILGMSPQSFSQKLGRKTFNDSQMAQIAVALGGRYVQYIELANGRKLGYHNTL